MAMRPRKIGEGLYQPLADINVTPLVDVMLVLLIIFMVTAPMLATGIKVTLPQRQDRPAAREQGAGCGLVAKDGAFSSEKTRYPPTSLRRRSRRSSATSTASSSCAATATRLTATSCR